MDGEIVLRRESRIDNIFKGFFKFFILFWDLGWFFVFIRKKVIFICCFWDLGIEICEEIFIVIILNYLDFDSMILFK